MNQLHPSEASPVGLFCSKVKLLLTVVPTGTWGQLEEIGEKEWSN